MATGTDEDVVLTSPPRPGAHRLKDYKTRGLDVHKIRTRKEEEGVQLRKERREEQVSVLLIRNIARFTVSFSL